MRQARGAFPFLRAVLAEPRTQRSGVSGNRGEPIVAAYSAPLRARLSRNAGASFFSTIQTQLTHLELDALLDFLDLLHVLGLGCFP